MLSAKEFKMIYLDARTERNNLCSLCQKIIVVMWQYLNAGCRHADAISVAIAFPWRI
jgi:hypothetical protein